MAKRSAPSSTFDSFSSSLNPTAGTSISPSSSSSPPSASRITRSAARLAADASTASPAAPNPATTPSQPSRSSRKRKGTQRDSSPELTPEVKPTVSSRRPKRQKISDTEPPPLTQQQAAQPRSRKSQGKSTAMSAPGYEPNPTPCSKLTASSPSEPVGDSDPASQPNPSSSKRKSNRNKKQSSATSPSTPQPSKRQPKKSTKKADDTPMPDADVNEKPDALGSQNKAGDQDESEDERALANKERNYENDEDDDDDTDDPFRSGFLGRGHGSLSSTMRALSGMMSHSGTASRLRELLENLRQKDDPSVQLVALNELSQLLLVSTEDNLSGHFSPDQFVKELVPLMQPNEFGEENPEMMLLACRCIANLMEALPPATASVVYGGAVPILCQKLLEIHFIDLAEQALSTLEKISVEFPASIVREGGLTACLSYLDFFATSTQRTAVTTAANCCRNIPEDSFSVVRDVMSILLDVLGKNDQRVVEQGSLCVSRVVESFKYHPDKLEELVKPDLLKAILRLLLPGSTNLIGPNIHTQFLRVLSITARASPNLSMELFKMDVIDTIYQILTGVSPPENTDDMASQIDGVVIMQALIHRPREQVYETLTVICELLPGIERDTGAMRAGLVRSGYPGNELGANSSGMSNAGSNSKRLELLQQCQDKVKRFATILLPTLTHAYSSTVNLSVRQKVLTAQLKMLSNLEVSILEDALRTVPFASYLASILSQKDHAALVIFALQAAELLLTRMEHVYSYQFYREGVFTEVSKLASQALSESKTDCLIKDGPSGGSGQKDVTGTQGQSEDASNRDSLEQDGEEGVIEELHELDEDDEDDDEDDEEDDEEDDGEDDENGGHSSHIRGGNDTSPSTSATSSDRDSGSSSPYSLDDHMVLCARALFDKLQDAKSTDVRVKAEAILQSVKALASNIKDAYTEGSGHDGLELFKSLSSHFSADALKSITSAELLSSGIVDVLLEVFDVANGLASNEARASFLDAFVGTTSQNSHPDSASSTASPFSVLVHKLQDLLSRAEHFEVITVHQNSFDSNRSSAASMLAKQLRLKLVADDESEIPKSFRNIMVSIHAIATFKALDDYLRPRISLSDRPRSGRHHDGLSSTLAAFAAATGGLSSHHQRLLDRGILGNTGDLSSIPAPPPPATAPPTAAKKSSSRRLSKEKPPAPPPAPTPAAPAVPAAPQTPTSQIEKSAVPRRVSRRHQESVKTPIPEQSTSDQTGEALECADERQLSDDEDDLGEANPLDTLVDDLEDEMEANDGTDPSAVNMEVASTGKVTARQDDGTRVPTPSQGSASHPPPQPQPRARAIMNTPSATARAMSYAAAIQSTPTDWHIEFSIDDQPIANDTTIYRAVHYNKSQPDEMSTRTVWSNIHPIKFKRVSGPPPSESSALSPSQDKSGAASDLPSSLHKHPETSKILRLLNTLHELNSNVDEVLDDNAARPTRIAAEPVAQFVNTKLTAKMNRQLEEPLIVASNCLPSWSEDLARLYPFLFPFETRHLFLQSTSFGYSRSMSRWQNAHSSEDSRHDRHRDDRPFLGRLQRQKVRISRSRILESAVKVMELYGSSPSVLEVEYFEEVGTGLGPTLEFYSTVSKEFSKKKSKMWRENESNSRDEYAFGKLGLFPAPMNAETAASENGKKILHLFKMLGKFVARSMLDSRIIDVSFNPVFFKDNRFMMASTPSLGVVKAVDADLASSLKVIKKYIQLKKNVDDSSHLTGPEKTNAARQIEIHGARVEDLGLDFTLPGYPAIELIDNGSNIPVTIDNIGQYLDKVLDLTLGTGVQRQIDAFRAGFSLVFPYSALSAFTPKELVMLFGRIEEDWTLETLMDSIKADHGFNMDSKSVRNLLQTMSELNPAQRRDFLQFVTGSPKLPIGGFKSLTPMFTVVCRPSEPPFTSDDYLPSVMTCVNYLKLPDYSDLDMMRTRLFTAIKEGQGAFHLS